MDFTNLKNYMDKMISEYNVPDLDVTEGTKIAMGNLAGGQSKPVKEFYQALPLLLWAQII